RREGRCDSEMIPQPPPDPLVTLYQRSSLASAKTFSLDSVEFIAPNGALRALRHIRVCVAAIVYISCSSPPATPVDAPRYNVELHPNDSRRAARGRSTRKALGEVHGPLRKQALGKHAIPEEGRSGGRVD